MSSVMFPDKTLSVDKSTRLRRSNLDRWTNVIYISALIVSILIWFRGIASPLAIDETGSYWTIAKGFGHIAARRGLCFPAYPYVLWLATRLTGTSEIGLHVPSLVAMLGATYLFYLCARELFQRETALIATMIFCVNPITIYQSTNARPYAFLILTTTAAIFVLLRLRKSNSLWLAGLFGLLAALIVYFHFLGAVILPAFLLCFILWKRHDGKVFWQQLGVAFAVFAVAFLPVIPALEDLFRTAESHVYQKPPNLASLLEILIPGSLIVALVVMALTAATTMRTSLTSRIERWKIPFCLSLALIPVLTIYGISLGTPIHMFTPRHESMAVPGISLCWALLLSLDWSRAARGAFCVVLVGLTAGFFSLPKTQIRHGVILKSALTAVQKNASPDHVPVLMPAAFIEFDSVKTPIHDVKESKYFAPLSYYKISVPVIPLPDHLNSEAKRTITSFLEQARSKHERFLAMGFVSPPYMKLDWLKEHAAKNFSIHELGDYDGTKVFEFQPKQPATKPK